MLRKLKIVFFFNGERGLKIFKYLKNKNISKYSVFLAKKNLQKKILNILSKEIVIDSLNNNDVIDQLKECDFAILGGFPYIFPNEILKLPRYGVINCHAGILPKYKGGSPLNWQIINNEKYFGITTLLANEKIDAGDIICEKKFQLKKKYDINSLHRIVNKEFPKLVEKSIIKILYKKPLKKQPKLKSYFKQRNKRDSYIDFKNKNFREINNFVRALQKPYPNPFIYLEKKKFNFSHIKKIEVKLKPGEILKKNKHVYIGCKNCTLKIW